MSRNEIITIIRGLSRSQGFYGRLLEGLSQTDPQTQDNFFNAFKDCKDEREFIMKLEGI